MPSLTAGHKTIDRRKNRRAKARDNRQPFHIFKFLEPTNQRRSKSGDSAWKQYKPLHALRHITNR